MGFAGVSIDGQLNPKARTELRSLRGSRLGAARPAWPHGSHPRKSIRSSLGYLATSMVAVVVAGTSFALR
jgi:hypothetical protein